MKMLKAGGREFQRLKIFILPWNYIDGQSELIP